MALDISFKELLPSYERDSDGLSVAAHVNRDAPVHLNSIIYNSDIRVGGLAVLVLYCLARGAMLST